MADLYGSRASLKLLTGGDSFSATSCAADHSFSMRLDNMLYACSLPVGCAVAEDGTVVQGFKVDEFHRPCLTCR